MYREIDRERKAGRTSVGVTHTAPPRLIRKKVSPDFIISGDPARFLSGHHPRPPRHGETLNPFAAILFFTSSVLLSMQGPSSVARWDSTTATAAGAYTGGSGSGSGSTLSPTENGVFAHPASAQASHLIPTPTEQTSSPRRQGMSNANPNGRGRFAFGFVPSKGHHNNSSSSIHAGDHQLRRPASTGGGGVHVRGGSGDGGKAPHEESSGVSPPSWWGGSERGAREVELEGGGGPAAFGEELDVFSAALLKDFELKVSERGCVENLTRGRAGFLSDISSL